MEQKQLVLAAPKAWAEGQAESSRQEPASLVEEASKALPYAHELQLKATSGVEELQNKFAKLEADVISLHERWDQKILRI